MHPVVHDNLGFGERRVFWVNPLRIAGKCMKFLYGQSGGNAGFFALEGVTVGNGQWTFLVRMIANRVAVRTNVKISRQRLPSLSL